MKDAAREWVSVSDAAKALGCSRRAIQKRAQRGDLQARKITRAGVEVWEIDGCELRHEQGANQAANGANKGTNDSHPVFAPSPSSERENGREQGAPIGANGANDSREHGSHLVRTSDDLPPFLARYIETLEKQVSDYRNTIEALQRDSADLRQSLKKALDLTPRQLASGAVEPAHSGTIETPQKPRESVTYRATPQHTGAATERAQCGTETPERALTYEDVLADLEARLEGRVNE